MLGKAAAEPVKSLQPRLAFAASSIQHLAEFLVEAGIFFDLPERVRPLRRFGLVQSGGVPGGDFGQRLRSPSMF